MKELRKPAVMEAFARANELGQPQRQEGAWNGAEPLAFRRLLVPSDFSDSARRALRSAGPLLDQLGARVILLHVLQPAMSADFTHFPVAVEEDRILETARVQLRQWARTCVRDQAIENVLVRRGNPFHEIAETARELKVDLILIPAHGAAGVKRTLLGSTTERVVRYAPCPVMVVR
jgi:nucleotide-binding universal stress UspA family protein